MQIISRKEFRLERIFQSIKLAARVYENYSEFRLERIFQSIKLVVVSLVDDAGSG